MIRWFTMHWSIVSGILSGILSAGAIATLAALINYYFGNIKDEKTFIRSQKIEIYVGLMNTYKKLKAMRNQRHHEVSIEEHKNVAVDYELYQFKLALFAPKDIIELNKKLEAGDGRLRFNKSRIEEKLRRKMRKDLGIRE